MNDQPSFMDPKTLLAIVFVGMIWVVWESHLEKKYPDAYKLPVATQPAAKHGKAAPQTKTASEPKFVEPVTETKIPYEDAKWKFTLSSRGMGVQNVILRTYTDRKNKPIVLGTADSPLYETRLKGADAPLNFDLKEVSPTSFKGIAKSGPYVITKTMDIHSSDYTFKTEITVDHVDAKFPGIDVSLSEPIKEQKTHGLIAMFSADRYETSDVFVSHGTSEDRKILQAKDSYNKSYQNVSVVGMSSQYFAVALLDQSSIMPTVAVQTAIGQSGKPEAVSRLSYSNLSDTGEMKIVYRGFAGPKSLDLLNSIDHRLGRIINFGMFGWIARPLLRLMKLIYAVVQNYGFAIIILTLLMRLVLMPINIMSYRSMKRMQVIQPQLKALREKHKDDPKTMNAESMALMRQHRVNPIGGCLPMALQIPIFFGLDRLLVESIELYKSPFMFWIHDLSLKDPYYILPTIMGIGMYFQQKLTPTAMDPAQAKMMMYMPIIFSVMMFWLPSGLNLYICVSTIFGILQQLLFVQNRTYTTAPASVKAKA